MNKIKTLIANIAQSLTSILSGTMLFLFSISIFITGTVMTPEFHRELFVKYDLYSHAETVIDSTVKELFKNSVTQLNQPDEQQKELFNIVENSTSPQMIKMNLDSMREGIFEYFRGEKNSLPDIYIDTKPLSDNNINDANTADEQIKLQSRIKKINLNAILLSLNQKNISDQLLFIKLVYFIISCLPALSLTLIALLGLIAFVLCKKPGELLKWSFFALVISAILCILSGVSVMAYLYRVLPPQANNIKNLIALDSGLIYSYIKACLYPVMVFSFSLAAILISGAILMIILNNSLLKLLQKGINSAEGILSKVPGYSKKTVKYCATALLFLLVLSASYYTLYGYYRDFNENNLSSAMSKITSKNTVTQVISAKDDTIYTLQIKLLDSKTGKAIPNIKINASGKSEIPDRYNNVNGITDEKGMVKFTLGKGNFYIEFSPVSLSCDYVLPSPFYYELKSAGTTIITINLDIDDTKVRNEGIVEIEVLGDQNLPLENLELTVISSSIDTDSDEGNEENKENEDNESNEDKKEIPDKYFSITNKEGLSVFKLPEGNYSVKFTSLTLHEQYIIPEPFNINITRDITTRYTIRLVKKAPGSNN